LDTQGVFSCTPQLATPKVQQLWSLFDCRVKFGRHSFRFAPLACRFGYGEGYVAAILLFSPRSCAHYQNGVVIHGV
jgi:hypothetical protein